MVNMGGAPKKVTEKKLRLLEEAFMMGCTNTEACLFADLAESTFYDYLKANPKFSERKSQLKKKPKLKARKNVINALDAGDLDTSKWYLQNKASDEFSPKSKLEQSGEVDNKITVEFK